MITLNPYLVFKGNCEEAFIFYKEVFGAESLYLGRYQDMPAEARKYFPDASDEKIMHATLKINPQTVVMGSDDVNVQTELKNQDSFHLYVHVDDLDSANQIFDSLAVGGKVMMPIGQTFWANSYGIVLDKFGIRWKITSG